MSDHPKKRHYTFTLDEIVNALGKGRGERFANAFYIPRTEISTWKDFGKV